MYYNRYLIDFYSIFDLKIVFDDADFGIHGMVKLLIGELASSQYIFPVPYIARLP